MQAQSRLSVSGSGGRSGLDLAAAEGREEVVRELTRGHELTARLQEQARQALRGQGQAEATAAFILQEVSRAFTVCLSIMAPGTPDSAAAAAAAAAATVASARRPRDDGAPRKRTVTSTPHFDGYQWRKYGQKKIMNTPFPRCYYKCSYHRERSCPATKQVQQRGHGEPPVFDVIYVHEHTCDAPASGPDHQAAHGGGAAMDAVVPLDSSGGGGGVSVLDHGAKAEQERALVSSLACVLAYGGGGPPEPSPPFDAAAGHQHQQLQLPGLGVDEGLELDVADYDVTDTMLFGASDSYADNDSVLY